MIEPARLADFFTIFFTSAMVIVLGVMFAAGFVLLVCDLLTIGKGDTRPMQPAISEG